MDEKSNVHLNMFSKETQNDNSISYEAALNLFRNLHVAHMMVFKAREQELKKYGISYEEVQTLKAILSIGGKPTVTDITHVSVKSYHTIAAIVKRLLRKGLVKKEQDPVTKRLWRLTITEKGQKSTNLALKTESLISIFSTFTENECSHLNSLLQRTCKSAILYTALKPTRNF